ncbi:hypothetical protein BTO04_08890 [Polaribacter sp. SA4-10]|uniref:nuclear transport factor 2 family protein n=1 Tax=Polaribacter sp. SA4-10 TaxID=754397 RepID=UPI000B3D0AFE|nr:nuclear transport factor 2 family protein [Polaribacter sp. SA4-10]ARV06791.1 hypothetical protein BTO04_08890 [Polaribacter sp. SA4-10]
MKKYSLFVIAILLFISCNQPKQTVSKEQVSFIKTEINTVLTGWHKAASDANYNEYFNKMDSISVFIGTDASENWTKNKFQAFSKPHFDKGKAWDFKTLERNIYVNNTGDFAWFDELLNTWMGTCRGSGVLEKKDKIWKIKHYVLSVEIPNDDVQAVISAKKKNDSIFLSTFKK